MRTSTKELRSNRRYYVRDLSYRASVVIGKQSIGLSVLDFSVNGLLIELPLGMEIPHTGTLRFREQAYQYVTRRQAIEDNMKQLGLEITPVQQEETGDSNRTDSSSWYMSGCEKSRWAVGKILFAFVALIQLGIAFFLLCGQSDSPYKSELKKLQGFINSLTIQGRSNARASVNPTIRSSSSSGTQQASTASDAVSRAKSFFRNEDYREAIKAADQAIAVESRNQEAWRLRGMAMDKLAHYDAAIESLQRALALSPRDPKLHEDLARTYLNSGRYAAAVKQGLRGIELADGETKFRLEALLASAYEARATRRLENDDAEGAQSDQAAASRWRRENSLR